MKKILQKIALRNDSDLFIILLSIVIFLSPLVVNYSDLPKGFELAKVNFLNLTTTILFIFFLFQLLRKKVDILQIFKRKKFFGLVIITFLSFYLSTILTSYPDVAFFGNSFRQQGFIFHFFLLIISVLSFFNINKSNYIAILFSIFLSSLAQSAVAISQFIDFTIRRPELIDDGLYINGTFGQANFFSTLIVLGIASSLLIFKTLLVKRFRFKKFIMFLLFLSFIILIIGLTISYSLFGWIIGGLTLIVLIPYIFLKENAFQKYFFGVLVFLIPLSVLLLNEFRSNLRYEIWMASIDIFFNNLSTQNQLFGSGFDTLGNVIRDSGKFPSAIIDRGHNILIDVLMQVGILGMTIFLIIIVKIFKNLKGIFSSHYKFSLFIIFFLFLLKIIVHEYSAVQTYLLFVLIGINLKAIKD